MPPWGVPGSESLSAFSATQGPQSLPLQPTFRFRQSASTLQTWLGCSWHDLRIAFTKGGRTSWHDAQNMLLR